MDIIYTIIIFAALFFAAFILWCTLEMASKYDDISEEDWQRFLEKEGEHDECERFYTTSGKTGQDD